MVRVTHGKFTKAVSKKMRPAEEEESEEEPAESEEEEEYKDSDEENDDGDDDDDDDSDEDASDDEDDEKDADKPEANDAKKSKKTRKRNQFVDDVAEEDDESDSDEEKPKKKRSKKDAKKSSKQSKKSSGAAAFIDDIAEVEDDDEVSDDEGDLDGEAEELDDGEREAVELEAQQRIHARYQNMENMERLENEEELEKRLKERYAAHRDKYEGDGVADAVDQQALHPTVRDPKLWMVTVKQGKERETVVCLMQKAINMRKTGKGAMAIMSASAQDHLKSYIYVEAEREDHVKKALAGMRHVYHMKPIRLVPIKEMVDSISVTKKKVENVVVGSWVRMRGGVYKGDLARVVDANYADNQCTVKLVPRFDYAHLQAKEEGAAAGRAKKDGAMRPPARLFTEAEARKHNLTFERGRQDRRMGDVVDMLCGQYKLKDGYHVKTISFVSCKLAEAPALDELQRYAAGEEATEAKARGGKDSGARDGSSGAEANLEALAASLGEGAGGSRDQNFRPGDQVVIAQGDLKNLAGVVERVNADGSVRIMPQHEMLHEALDIDRDHLRKSFKLGSHVRCVHGRHEGESGLVVKVEGEVATVFGDVTKEEFVVFSHHLADVAEASRRVESVGEYGTHDLVMLEDGSVGMVVRVEKDAAVLMMQTSSVDRPDVRPARLHDMRRKVNTRGLSAVDGSMETLEVGSMARVADGPGKGMTITVVHIWKGVLWGKARDVAEHGGIVVVRARDCRAHGARGGGGGGGFAAAPQSPGSALLRSPAREARAAPAAPRAGAFGGGRVGRRDNDLIGTVARIGAGVYKGYKGKIVDATETTVRVELEAQSRTVTVQRAQLAGAGTGGAGAGAYNPPDAAGVGAMDYDFPGAGQPISAGARTPHYGAGSATPMRDDGAGGRTPLHASAWNPTTPAHDASAWSESDLGAGTGTPGGLYSGTPAGLPSTPAGYGQGGATATTTASADPDFGYSGPFVTDAVVALADGRQGVLRSRQGSDARVAIGTSKTLANGDKRLESLDGSEVTVSLSQLALAKPQKKDRVRVVAGEDNRGASAELIGVDGADGVVKLDQTKDISIHEIGALARIWVG
jgi:transcription elongation factor SPT5